MTRKTPEFEQILEDRRKLLKAAGGAALLVSVSGIAACSGGDSGSSAPAASAPQPAPAPAATPAPAPEPAPEPAADMAEPVEAPMAEPSAPAAGGQMPRLAESDPQAQGLGYVNDATSVDSAAQPRYESGQACGNCVLFLGQEGDEWGPCSIFPGRQVNRAGWCTVYSAKA